MDPHLVSQPQQEAGMGGQQHIPQLQKPIGQQHPALLFGHKDKYTPKEADFVIMCDSPGNVWGHLAVTRGGVGIRSRAA